MSRAARLLRLVQLLDSRAGRTRDQLLSALDVSERTLYRDLAEIEELGIPLTQTDGRYRLVESASWRPLVLTARERATLRLLLGTPALRRDAVMRDRLEALASKLTAAVDGASEGVVLADRERSGPIPESVVKSIEEAITRQETLRVEYVSISSASRRVRRIDPWALLHRGEVWYLAGRCHERGGPRMFRLDRIKSTRPTGDLFLRPENFDVDAWLRDAWSLWHGEEPREIVIRFEREVAPLVEHAAHHDGEEVRRLPDGSVEYRVRPGHIEEIARWVATFGGSARAVEPPELVERVREMGEGIIAVHAAGDRDEAWETSPVAAKTAKATRRRTRPTDRN